MLLKLQEGKVSTKMKKAIAAAALAASFSGGYYAAPKTELPHAVNASTIRQHEDAQKALEACRQNYARSVQMGSTKVPPKAPATK